eukprot:CAMPEP_0117526618 /NCGR_PEP_ID=MMETSP0784-20121206/36376_1 /TAXON_ID=39447 /ORGANISM="" /LENGTH=365 /DNA_ID=CAMNT_0005322847 /DNA_START=56 /DNA_END=1153 /DNA_ORIENTATION=+
MKVFVAHWGDVASRLPIDASTADKSRRSALFESFDPDGKGILFQAHVVRGLFRLLPTISGITDTRTMLNRAFRTTVSLVPPVAPIGIDNVDRNQFRVLLVYVWWYLKCWELLYQHPLKVKGHVSFSEFQGTLCWLQEWGFPEAKAWADDPAFGFNQVSGGANAIPVEDFVDRLLVGALLHLSSADADEERRMASRSLERTHPHLVNAKQEKKLGRPAVSAPPVPPPGQRCPPLSLASEPRKPDAFRRWSTSYMSDYESPSRRCSASSVHGSLPPSRVSHGRAVTRAGTPPAKGSMLAPSYNFQSPGMQRNQSVPESNMRLTNMDRKALRVRLEKHLEMSSTMHMRSLLKVAGGMVMAGGPEHQRR